MADAVAVVVAFRNGEQLADCLDAANASVGADLRIVLVNNDSSDPYPRKLALGRPNVELVQPKSNVGFCAAVNLAARGATERFLMILSPDGRVEPPYAGRLIEQLDQDESIGAISGLIRRMKPNGDPTDVIDSRGIEFRPGRIPADIDHGSPGFPASFCVQEVFGVTAAATMYRISALEAVSVNGQILPDDFFMYLDDVDLAWRLRWAGYRAVVDHSVTAWHARELAGDRLRVERFIVARKVHSALRFARQPGYLRALWWSNRLLMLVRNDDASMFLSALGSVATARWMHELAEPLLRPDVALWARVRFARLLPRAVRDRAAIKKMRRVHPQALAQWLA